MGDSFVQDGKIVKTCDSCGRDCPIGAYVVEEGESLSDVCCNCEGGHEQPEGLDLEARPYGERLSDGFAILGGDE